MLAHFPLVKRNIRQVISSSQFACIGDTHVSNLKTYFSTNWNVKYYLFLSFVGGSKFAEEGPYSLAVLGRGVRIRYRIWTGGPNLGGGAGPNPLGRRETTFELTHATVKAFLSDIISSLNHIKNFPRTK